MNENLAFLRETCQGVYPAESDGYTPCNVLYGMSLHIVVNDGRNIWVYADTIDGALAAAAEAVRS